MKEKFKLLLPGDIIFELDAENNLSEAKKSPWHCWIYTGTERPIAHSSAGGSISGVTAHTLQQYFKADSDHKSIHFEVWRVKNPELRNIFLLIALGIVLSCPKALLKFVKELGVGNPDKINLWGTRHILFTPYCCIRKKDQNLITEKARFRAARAAIRADQKSPAPLSKIKGVNCHQFVGFSLQAAVIKFILGRNINELKEQVTQISDGGLKQAKIGSLKLFSKSFEQQLKENYNSENKDLTLKACLEFCSYNLKGVKIIDFFKFFKKSSLVDFAGNLAIIDLPGKPQLLIIDKHLSQTLADTELPLLHASRADMINTMRETNVAPHSRDCCVIS